MIIDHINNSSRYDSFSENFVKALFFLKNTSMHGQEKGRHEVCGEDIFFIVDEYKTKSVSEGHWSHIENISMYIL